MSPLTLADAEQELCAAYLDGSAERITAAEQSVTHLDVPRRPASILAAALWYAEQGLPVFPLQARSKIPHKGTRGCKDATTDADTIRAWWDRWPDSNVAIATGHLLDVVDIDGPAGQASRCGSWDMFTALDVLATVTTPRPGGMHLYVPRKEGISNGAGLLPGIDYRGLGGYVVAPPSVTDVGSYRFLRPIEVGSLAVAA